MVEVVGMLGMVMVCLAFVPVFKWLGRHYDNVEAKNRTQADDKRRKSMN